MFRGQHNQTIDPKGRIILPVKFREVLVRQYDARLIITKYPDNCLIAYPVVEWEKKEAEILTLPTGKKEVRAWKRFFISSASECPVDKQGRVLIPAPLKEFARLEKEIVIAGSIDHFEIWNKTMFAENTEPDEHFADSDAASDILDKLGF
ncbi:MAG: division/cell wall cluster transcriptional repressor MraZ [Deltaproteobacteria bacterium]|nr:division/cell wall cluster transcriptional repressor MraZ [Deltaproteobacteria bacterium]